MNTIELAARLCGVPLIDYGREGVRGVLVGSGAGIMMITDPEPLREAVVEAFGGLASVVLTYGGNVKLGGVECSSLAELLSKLSLEFPPESRESSS